jgi:hypothetical protein
MNIGTLTLAKIRDLALTHFPDEASLALQLPPDQYARLHNDSVALGRTPLGKALTFWGPRGDVTVHLLVQDGASGLQMFPQGALVKTVRYVPYVEYREVVEYSVNGASEPLKFEAVPL